MKKYYLIFSEGSKINQVICAILINLPVFAYGASIGWMSPMSLLLQSDRSPRPVPLTDLQVSWIASVAYIVCIPADILLEICCDKIGRKATLLCVSAIGVAAWTLKLSSMEVWAFIAARALIGVTMASAYVACPLYTKEISEDSVRGVLGSLLIFAHTSGNLFLYVIGDVLSYRAVLWVCLALPASHLALFTIMPESPSYLVKNGKMEEAARALAWLRCRAPEDARVVDELDAIKREQKIDDEVKPSSFVLKTIVSDRYLRRAFTIAMVATLSREVCGAIPVLNFAGEIFERAGAGGGKGGGAGGGAAGGVILSANQQAMALGAVQVAGAIVASSLIEKAGRRPLLILTALVSGLSMVALASWFLARDHSVAAPGWIPVVTLCLCIFCDAAGLQPLSVVVTGEIFSYKYRGSVMATTMACASFAAFLQTLFFKPLASFMGVHVAFYSFGGVCLLAGAYFYLQVPETKMRTVHEIYADFRTHNEKKQDMDTEKSRP